MPLNIIPLKSTDVARVAVHGVKTFYLPSKLTEATPKVLAQHSSGGPRKKENEGEIERHAQMTVSMDQGGKGGYHLRKTLNQKQAPKAIQTV